MTARRVSTGPARHERPAIDEAALAAARAVDVVLVACRRGDLHRWEAYLAPLADALRDVPLSELRSVALRVRAAFGPKDSILEVLEPAVTDPLRDAIDRLLRTLARDAAERR
jgi:hypothetical protein